MSPSHLDYLGPEAKHAKEVLPGTTRHDDAIPANFLSESEPRDQDTKSINSSNSNDDALEVPDLFYWL